MEEEKREIKEIKINQKSKNDEKGTRKAGIATRKNEKKQKQKNRKIEQKPTR
jgi:hypothetical protein